MFPCETKGSLPGSRGQFLLYIFDAYPFLFGQISLSDRYRAVFQCLMVDGYGTRHADFIGARVEPAESR